VYVSSYAHSLARARHHRPADPRLSIVIPARNEARNLEVILPELPPVHEVILVDGESVDGTVDVARRMLPTIRIVSQTRTGKGNALACGFAAATGDIVIMFDADGSAIIVHAGADDYMVKPFDPEELSVRVKMILRRTIRTLDANPLTHLPGNTSIVEELRPPGTSTLSPSPNRRRNQRRKLLTQFFQARHPTPPLPRCRSIPVLPAGFRHRDHSWLSISWAAPPTGTVPRK